MQGLTNRQPLAVDEYGSAYAYTEEDARATIADWRERRAAAADKARYLRKRLRDVHEWPRPCRNLLVRERIRDTVRGFYRQPVTVAAAVQVVRDARYAKVRNRASVGSWDTEYYSACGHDDAVLEAAEANECRAAAFLRIARLLKDEQEVRA